jgi:hypothetical protein
LSYFLVPSENPIIPFSERLARTAGKLVIAILKTGNPSGIVIRICAWVEIRFQTDWEGVQSTAIGKDRGTRFPMGAIM